MTRIPCYCLDYYNQSIVQMIMEKYDSGDINVDGEEIVDAKWFKKEDINEPETDISVFSYLIDKFLGKEEK